MKIFGICVTKNESDIIGKVLYSALRWCDKIFVVNNVIDDKTSQLVKTAEKDTGRIHLVLETEENYSGKLFSYPFHRYKHLASANEDWWCRLDSDEIYIDNPRKILAQTPKIFKSIYSESCQYYFTTDDLKKYSGEPQLYENGNCVENLHFFKCNHSEIRFFRHGNFNWPRQQGWPDQRQLFPIAPWRIRLAHYQFRYPEQIQHRIDSRLEAAKSSGFRHELRFKKHAHENLPHVDPDHWSSRIFSPADMFDDRRTPVSKPELATKSYRPSWPRQAYDIFTSNFLLGKARYKS